MTDLYDQRIDAMKAVEYEDWHAVDVIDAIGMDRMLKQTERNPDRLAAYKRKRAEYV